MKKADIGLIGLAVMGENLVMNMESKGFTVAVYNRTVSKVDAFVEGRANGKNIIGCHSLEELAANLEKPRRVMMMVKAGEAVDSFIEMLLGVLEPGDIIIDGGNSHFPDTMRRTAYVESKGLLYIGTGVSGGEEGGPQRPVPDARRQPRCMALCEGHLPEHLRPCRGWLPLLRLGWRERRRPLRQDGPQRHRVRRHAAHLRSLPADA